MLPAGERLHADDLDPCARSACGWKYSSISSPSSARAELRGEREPLAGVGVALARVELAPRLGFLGLVHRDVGALEQLFGGVAWAGKRAIPTLASTRRAMSCTSNGWASASRIRSATVSANARVRRCVEHDAELVAAEPRQGVDRPQDAREPRADLAQQHVAAVVAERVVQFLEVVEVDDEDGQASPRAAAARDRFLEPLVEEAAVGRSVRSSVTAWRRASLNVRRSRKASAVRRSAARTVRSDRTNARSPRCLKWS